MGLEMMLAVASLPYSVCSFMTPSGTGSRPPPAFTRERRSLGALALQRPRHSLGHRASCRCSFCTKLVLRDTPPDAATFAGLDATLSKVDDDDLTAMDETVISPPAAEVLSDKDIMRLPQVDGSLESLLATLAEEHNPEGQRENVAAVSKASDDDDDGGGGGGEVVEAQQRILAERIGQTGTSTKTTPKKTKKKKTKADNDDDDDDDDDDAPSQRRLKASVRETGRDSMKDYMKSMGSHDLLNRNEEVVLAKEIQKLMKWEETREMLEVQLLRPPTYAEWAAAVEEGLTVTGMKKQIRKSLRAKSALTESNLRLVLSIARKYLGRGVAMQDLCQEGIVGLNRAVEKFDPSRKSRFSSYASWWIRQGIMKAINGQSKDIRVPVHVKDQLTALRKVERDLRFELGRDATTKELAAKLNMKPEKIGALQRSELNIVSMELDLRSTKSKGSGAGSGGSKNSGGGREFTLGDVLRDKGAKPENGAEQQMMKDDISRLICTLNPREQAVIRLRFGLDDGKAKTLEEIGNRFSVTRERIRQIEARALHKLRQPFRNYSIKCYTREL